MRRHIKRGKVRVAVTRALALAGAAFALTCGSLFFLAAAATSAAATSAAAACGDGVTYQASQTATAGDSCPDTGAGKAVGVAAGAVGGAAAALFARVIVRSVASGGDLATMEKELVSVELVSREEATVRKAYPGASDLPTLMERQDLADAFKEGGEGENETAEDAFDSVPETAEPLIKHVVVEPEPEEPQPANVTSTGQTAITNVSSAPPVYKEPEPEIINPVRDITVLVVAGHQAVVWMKNGKPWLRGGRGE